MNRRSKYSDSKIERRRKGGGKKERGGKERRRKDSSRFQRSGGQQGAAAPVGEAARDLPKAWSRLPLTETMPRQT